MEKKMSMTEVEEMIRELVAEVEKQTDEETASVVWNTWLYMVQEKK